MIDERRSRSRTSNIHNSCMDEEESSIRFMEPENTDNHIKIRQNINSRLRLINEFRDRSFSPKVTSSRKFNKPSLLKHKRFKI